MESIEKLQQKKDETEYMIKELTLRHKIIKQEVERLEKHLREQKTFRNKTYNQLLTNRKKLIQLTKKIKTLPSQIRSRTKANMGKAINNIMGEQQ